MNCQTLNLNKTELKWKIIRRLEVLDPEDSIYVGAIVLAIKDHPERFEQTIEEIVSQYNDNKEAVKQMIGYRTTELIIHYKTRY